MGKEASSSDGNLATPAAERVYIVILNWNGWRDTIECLESVFRLDYPCYKVLVCDNASSDDSMVQIRRWAQGKIIVNAKNPALASLTSPPIAKPIPFLEVQSTEPRLEPWDASTRLLLMQTKANLGFAGGNNAALRYALKSGDCDFAWLLNNDTVVCSDALRRLMQRMKERPDAGICGSTLLYYDDPSKVQAFGGSVYNQWVARVGPIGKLASAAELPQAEEIERKMAYIIGASMLVRRSFLEQIGLMDEEYFLYFEELDWATLAKGRFQLGYCPHSVVYHKEGRTIGSNRVTYRQSALAEFYMIRNRIVFTRKHHPLALGSVLCAILLSGLHRLFNRRWSNFTALTRGAFEGLTVRLRRRKQEL
jgi:GT2 family glycosyltransferase